MVVEAILLGFSTGTYCAVFCAPVAIPMILTEEQRGALENARRVGVFLLGRLIAYIGVGLLLGFAGAYSLSYVDPGLKRPLQAVAYLVIGAVMIASGIMYNFPDHRACKGIKKIYNPERGAFIYGLMTGMSICPSLFRGRFQGFCLPGSAFGRSLLRSFLPGNVGLFHSPVGGASC